MYCPKCGVEIADESEFCSKCGAKIRQNNISGTSEIGGSKKQKIVLFKNAVTKIPILITKKVKSHLNKKTIIISSIVAFVLIISIVSLVLLNNPVVKFEIAITQSKYTDAEKLYTDKIQGNASMKKSVDQFLNKQVQSIQQSFTDNKIDFKAAQDKLNSLQSVGSTSSDVSSALDKISQLNNSRNSFNKANSLIKNNDYVDALQEYNNVIKDDKNYSVAQKNLSEYKAKYKDQVLKNSEDAATKQDYDGAIKILSDATTILTNDPDISAKKTIYEKSNADKKAAELKKAIDDAKANQQLSVVSAKITIQSDTYKALYPDMIQVIVKNNSNKTVKNMEVSCLGFDSNGLPIPVKTFWDSYNASMEFVGNGSNVNIVPNATYGDGVGWKLDESHGMKTVLACVKDVEYYDGSKWDNPYYTYWINEYKGKQLH